jgi:hydrogenase small subunit
MPVQTLEHSLTDCLIRELQKKNGPEQPKTNLIWLELTGCSGNIISLLDGHNPNFQYLITDMVNLIYSNSLMSAEGEAATQNG